MSSGATSSMFIVSNTPCEPSAQNCFPGKVIDMAPARLGAELTIDIGVNVVALVASNAIARMSLECGKMVWVNLNATAARYIEK